MSGRRRTGALVGALDLATNLLGYQIQQQQERRRRAEDIFLKLAVEQQLNEAKRSQALAQLQQGALAGTELVPVGYTDPVTNVRYTSPRAIDPSLTASRLSGLQKDILAFESLNAEEQAKARPASKGFFGLGASPGYTPRTVDTSALQGVVRQLEDQLRGGGASAGGVAPQRPAPSIGALPALSVEPVPQEELDDLLNGIQRGVITSRAKAESFIEQAGYDPSDPAFQAILNQLP